MTSVFGTGINRRMAEEQASPDGTAAAVPSAGGAPAEEGRAARELRELMQSGRPLLYIRSAEERRIGDLLRRISQTAFARPVPLWRWSLTEGLRRVDEANGGDAQALGARQVLDWIIAHQEPGIFELRDFHEFMTESAEIRRRLRDVNERCLDSGKTTVLSSPIAAIPDELTRAIALIELSTPDLPEVLEFVSNELDAIAASGSPVEKGDQLVFEYARALQGLTLDEARFALRRALAQEGRLDAGAMPHLLQEKRMLVKKTGMIEFISDSTDIGDIGGLEYLKRWLLERRKLFHMRESVAAEIVPKGILVMGISGCGKSLSVKAIASYFRLPLYRIDMIEVFSGRHGSPDAAFVDACRTVEALSPAVVWFDEIEMGITAQTGEASNLGRIFAFFLTWMQEKARGLFIAATANRIDLLPAELIRKGRFDEVFFVDLPSDEERMEIFRIHLARRGIEADKIEVERLKRFTRGWSGAEIEQCVISALTSAGLEERELSTSDLVTVATTIVPLSRTMKEQVDRIRSWAHERAARASPREVQR